MKNIPASAVEQAQDFLENEREFRLVPCKAVVTMQSRDLVLKTIEFRSPGRIPLAQGESADIVRVGYNQARKFVPLKEGMNEWGCVWKSLNPGAGDQGQVIEHPLNDWSRFEDFRFPDPCDCR